jgi:tellurite resistance protein
MVWNKLTGRGVTPEVRAYLETMLMLSLADGELEDEEIQDLGTTIARHPKMADLGSRQVIDTLMKAWKDIEKQGMNRRMNEIAGMLNHDQRIDAIGMAISIAASDGEIEPDERSVLERLQQAFNLSDADVEEAMERYR